MGNYYPKIYLNLKMGCFANRTKKKMAKIIFIISIVMVLAGLGAGLFGFFGIEKTKDWKLGDKTWPSPTALFGLVAILAGIFVFFTGLLGLAAAHFKKCCFTMPFSIFALILSLLMLVAALLGLMAQDEASLRKTICEKPEPGAEE